MKKMIKDDPRWLAGLTWLHYFVACYSVFSAIGPWWADPSFVVNLYLGARRQWQCAKALGWL